MCNIIHVISNDSHSFLKFISTIYLCREGPCVLPHWISQNIGYIEGIGNMKKTKAVKSTKQPINKSRNLLKAAVFVGPKKELEIRDYPVQKPRKGQVGLKLELSGICGTDIHIHEGRLVIPGPMVLGHEFIGTVDQIGAGVDTDAQGKKLRKGDKVIVNVGIACGKCFSCKNDETASCLNFGVTYLKDPAKAPHFFGGYAEYSFAPATNCIKVPPSLDLKAVAAFPCAGPTAIRAYAFAGGLKKGELVVVQGTGPVGMFAIAWAAAAGCTVMAIGSGSNPDRMKLAKKLGAVKVLDYKKVSEAKRLEEVQKMAAKLKRGNGADVVFEASGAPSAVPEGLNLVRTRGRYSIPGQYSDSGTIAIAPHLITFKAINIIGSGQYKAEDIVAYMNFLKKHKEVAKTVAACVTHTYPVSKANQAMKDVSNGKSVKAVFTL